MAKPLTGAAIRGEQKSRSSPDIFTVSIWPRGAFARVFTTAANDAIRFRRYAISPASAPRIRSRVTGSRFLRDEGTSSPRCFTSRSLLQTRFKDARTTCEMHRDLCSFDVLIFFVYLPVTLR